MKKQIIQRKALLLASLLITHTGVCVLNAKEPVKYQENDYGFLVELGDWGMIDNWKKWDGEGWNLSAEHEPTFNDNVFILSGNTVIIEEDNKNAKTLLVESGAKLFTNSTNLFSPRYININQDIVCDGIIGNGKGINDAISFNINGNDATIKGNGELTANRIRKNSQGITHLSIEMDLEVRYNGWAFYNTQTGGTNALKTTINQGAIVNLNGNGMISNGAFVLKYQDELVIFGRLSFNGNSYMEGKIFNEAGPSGLLLRSDATGSASLLHYCEGVEATVERYIPGDWSNALAGWHLISSPVSGQSINDFVTQGAGNDYDFYGWDEVSNSWINQKSNDFTIWNQGSDFNTAEGYLISYEQTQTDLAFKGALHVNDVHINELSYNTGKGGDPGWHLLGNPFASAIDWNDGQGWMPQNIQGQPQVWNSTMQDYEPVNIIPAMNGFMIRVADPQEGTHSGSITIPADLRQHDTGHWYKSDDDNTQRICLQVSDLDHGTAKSSTLLFHPEASSGIDRRDTYFLSGNGPGFYSLADNTRLSVNVLPERHPELLIRLGFEKNRGNRFLLEVTEQIPGQDLYLFDRKLDNAHKLCSEHPYPFTAFDDDEPLRFELHFQAHGMGTGIREATAEPSVWINGQTLLLDFAVPAPGRSLEVFDTSGRRLMCQGLNESTQHSINLNLAPGVYLIRIAEPQNITTRRIMITQ